MSMNFNTQKVTGGWFVEVDVDNDHDTTLSVVIKDAELIEQFKAFVAASSVQVLNENA